MKGSIAISLWLAAAAALGAERESSQPQDSTPSATLRWRNTETLRGELIEASAAHLTWKTPLFSDPLVLRWEALRRIDEPFAPRSATEPFSFRMRDGSYFHGDLVAISDMTVSIRSARHGEAVLKRTEVLSARRARSTNLLFAGPAGDVGWSALAEEKNNGRSSEPPTRQVPALKVGAGGALLFPYWNGRASLEIALPERLDLLVRVRSSMRPDFQLLLDGTAQERLRVAMWDDELVLAVGDQFKSIRKVGDEEREIGLRICWDRKARNCAVFTPSGELLIEWQVPDDTEGRKSRLVLENKGRDLSLDFLQVRTWDGNPPIKTEAPQPRIEMADGRVFRGEIAGAAEGVLKVRPADRNEEASLPLAEADALVFSEDAPDTKPQPMTVTFADGTILGGELVSLSDGNAALKTSFTAEPFQTRSTALRQLLVNDLSSRGRATAPPLAEFDKLVVQQTTLHGKLTSAGDSEPRWLAVGAVRPARPVKSSSLEISRAVPADDQPPVAPALFYTSAGDVLPGTLRALDSTGVEFDSDLVENRRLPGESLAAIQFRADVPGNLRGFSDASWRVLKGDENTVRRNGGSIEMAPATSIGHASAMQSGAVKFTLTTRGFGSLRLRMFCPGTEAGAQSSNLLIANMGGRLTAGLEGREGQFTNQTQSRVEGNILTVGVIIDEKQIELQFNGVLLRRFSIPASKRSGVGLIIEPANVWGNTTEGITLSDFAARTAPGRIWLPDVSVETKAHALTIPRFRKDDPPGHALLAANGDVLRGEIQAVSATHLGFRSGLENLRVPVDRVKAAIWLKKPDKEAPLAGAENGVVKRLEQRIENHTHYSGAGLKSLIAVLERNASDLKFKLPAKQDQRSFGMQFGGQTIGEALEEICQLFGLRYRIDNTGTIVVEKGTSASGDLVQKIYWLKNPGLGVVPTHEIFAAKGVPFPPGAAALWEPAPKVLSVVNTPQNQEKLAAILEAEFGGVLGSPTHWLLLTGGGRIALEVDEFREESIVGRHPVYGRCTVPMSQVYGISASPPPPTAAMRSLANWRLTFAPEPVLPASGGENSPTLGKAAPPFKLPLLTGGDFDLTAEKGKVVVLDFWATWCGPCTRSLPDLIEAMSGFSEDQVKLIGVNQAEPPERVKLFLETRKWNLSVVMDGGQSVSRQYGVDGIPHTVIVGPDGKVVWVKAGYSPEGASEVADKVKQLLAASAPIAAAVPADGSSGD